MIKTQPILGKFGKIGRVFFCISLALLPLKVLPADHSSSAFLKERPNRNDKTFALPKEKAKRYQYIVARGIKPFFEKLNKLGKEGYRLKHLTRAPFYRNSRNSDMIMAGIVKFDGEGRYEYEWFEAFEAETILTRINFYSKNGYRFHSSLPVITGACDRDRGAESSDKTDAEIALEQIAKGISSVLYGSIFILERGHRLEAKGDFRIVSGNMGWGKNPTADIQKYLDAETKLGYVPIAMTTNKVANYYSVSILVKRNQNTPASFSDVSQSYKFIKTEFNFRKKLSRLAGQNYDPIFVGQFGAFNLALLKKAEKQAKPFSYEWIDTEKKKFKRDFLRSIEKGTVFASTIFQISGCDYAPIKLLVKRKKFKQKRDISYQFLSMKSEIPRDQNARNPDSLLIPSQNNLNRFNQLLDEDFQIKTIYYRKGINILFERIK